MSVIVYQQPGTNRVAICVPSPNTSSTLEQIIQKSVPSGCPRTICNRELIPKISTFFDAWTYEPSAPNSISIDVLAAQEIWKNRWRKTREPILARLDVEWMRALERGDTATCQSIVDKKQILRDITELPLPNRMSGESIDDFSTRLKSVWPECLTW